MSISSGEQHTCALRSDGSPVCWGYNEDGRASPPQDERFASISAGSQHTCALLHDGSPICWGYNRDGQASPPENEQFAFISAGGFTHVRCVATVHPSAGDTSRPTRE